APTWEGPLQFMLRLETNRISFHKCPLFGLVDQLKQFGLCPQWAQGRVAGQSLQINGDARLVGM
ncbi:MAG: hypothetical protein ACRC7C_03825, partial [Beijerinckiaceae bacterium]